MHRPLWAKSRNTDKVKLPPRGHRVAVGTAAIWSALVHRSRVSTAQGEALIVAVLLSLASSAPVLAGTFVYVSNAEDGDIGMYTLQADGSLQPGQRFKANKLVMPMVVSPDKHFLIAAVRSKPFQAYSYSIDKSSGALNPVGTGALAES